MRVKIVALIIVLAALAAGIFFYSNSVAASGESAKAIEKALAHLLRLPGDWTPVKRGDFEISIAEEGELRPVKVTSLTFLTPGKIGFMVPEGTYVKKGDRVIALETKDAEEEFSRMQEDLAAADVALAQQEQTRDLELKRFAAELQTEKEKSQFSELKLRETLAHPNEVEKEEARNLIDGAKARLKAAKTELEVLRPLVKEGINSREDLELKEVEAAKAELEMLRAEMKARKIQDGPLPQDRMRTQLDCDYAKLGYEAKELDNSDQTDALGVRVQSAERAVKALQRKNEKRKTDLERSTLHAPHEGVVVYRNMSYRGNKKAEVGERVSPWSAPVDLPNYARMKVRTQVPESLIRKIHARTAAADESAPVPVEIKPKLATEKFERGSPARVFIKTIPGVVYTAQVTWIDGWARDRNSKLSDADIKAQGFSGVKVFDVEVELDESDPAHLREGFRATVEFPQETLRDVLAIPEQAVSTVDGVSSVSVLEGGSPAVRRVMLGRASQGKVVILSGLKPGELVYVPRIDHPAPEKKKEDDKKTPGKKGGGERKRAAPPGEKKESNRPVAMEQPAKAAPSKKEAQ